MMGTFLVVHLTYKPSGTTGFTAYFSATMNAINVTAAPAKSPIRTDDDHAYELPARFKATMSRVSHATRSPMPSRSRERIAAFVLRCGEVCGMCTTYMKMAVTTSDGLSGCAHNSGKAHSEGL